MKTLNKIIKMTWVLVLSLTILVACGDKKVKDRHDDHTGLHKSDASHVEMNAEQYKIAGIDVGKVEVKQLSDVLKLNGVVEAPPQQKAIISAPMGGFVVSTDLIPGMKIRKGQRLVTLQNSDYVKLQLNYLETKNELDLIQLEYDRQLKLSEEKVSSTKVFQETEARYKKLRTQLKGLSEQLRIIGIVGSNLTEDNISRKVSLYAPFDGYVSSVNAVIGKFVNSSDIIFELVDSDNAHVALTVFEKDIHKIEVGQEIELKAPNIGDAGVIGQVYLIEKEVDSKRSLRVYVKFNEKEQPFAIGQYINGWVKLNNAKVYALPEQAIVKFDNKTYVFAFEGLKVEADEKKYHFQMIEVEKGVQENGFSEIKLITKGTLESMVFVTSGAFSLLAKVKNVEEEGEGHGH